MTAQAKYASNLKSKSKSRVILLFVVGVAAFLPTQVSIARSVERAEPLRQEQRSFVLNKCSQGPVRIDPFKFGGVEKALLAVSSAPRPKPRPALRRLDDEFGAECPSSGDISVREGVVCTNVWGAPRGGLQPQPGHVAPSVVRAKTVARSAAAHHYDLPIPAAHS